MKLVSYLVGIAIALVVLAPPINFDIPLMVNSQHWVFIVIACAMFGIVLLSQDLHWSLKCLVVYLFADSFISQVPYYSFNAYIALILAYYFFVLVKKCDMKILLMFVEAAFWVEVMFLVAQHFGKDTLVNFDRPEKVFFGTVAQQMRMGSVLAVMTPLLVIKNRWYIIPAVLLSIFSFTLGFSIALAVAILFYICVTVRAARVPAALVVVVFCLFVAFRSWTHIHVEIVEGRLPIWWVIIKSWVLDTHGTASYLAIGHHFHDIFGASQTGPWCWRTFLFGHGPDSFIALFGAYKHDFNTGFIPAHNDWLQIPWEIGITGFSFFLSYCAWLTRTLKKDEDYILLAGALIISINMFFAFPMRMTQTMGLMILFCAYCETKIKKGSFYARF